MGPFSMTMVFEKQRVPSLKPTARTWKNAGWKMSLLLKRLPGVSYCISFKECECPPIQYGNNQHVHQMVFMCVFFLFGRFDFCFQSIRPPFDWHTSNSTIHFSFWCSPEPFCESPSLHFSGIFAIFSLSIPGFLKQTKIHRYAPSPWKVKGVPFAFESVSWVRRPVHSRSDEWLLVLLEWWCVLLDDDDDDDDDDVMMMMMILRHRVLASLQGFFCGKQ